MFHYLGLNLAHSSVYSNISFSYIMISLTNFIIFKLSNFVISQGLGDMGYCSGGL